MAQNRQGKHNIALSEKRGMHQENQHHGVGSHIWYTQIIHKWDECNQTQASGPKDQQAQAHEGHQAWQTLDLGKQTWI